MGGRMAEMFDWMHTEPEDGAERCRMYGSFTTDNAARKAKNAWRRENKSESGAPLIDDPMIENPPTLF
jgi:hypothetical protein